ncbi:hypothetical protein CNR22_19180 [Sphingobacteriaceae bacterium]|nr:hypothetical protein CNR22_19180 [Sphingobacteriaceae bacterium]
MKESEFIEQNKEKWLEFENNLQKNDVDPAKTSKLFVQITDDLSYARTFYKSRSVKLYLNGTAKLLFNDLNKSQKKGSAAFIKFWKTDLPLTMYHSRRAMLISFLVFVACFILGVVTSIQDKEFAASILSKDYVNMTNENIAKGDAMGVYKRDSEMKTFLPILYNNLKVDFLTFFSGIFMAIGSLVIMVVNGVMVGVFQYFFIEKGLFWESFLGIWTHGSLEIPAIILSGGAGLTLGRGLLFPGTHSRFQAFKLSGMNGLKIIIGVAPLTLLAAFIEGFLTRHTDIPDLIRFVFILIAFSFVLIYFFIYPRRVAKSQKDETTETKSLIYKAPVVFDPSEIYTGAKILTETFRLLFSYFAFFGRYILLFSLLCAFLVASNPLNLFHFFEDYSFAMTNFFDYDEFPFLGVASLLIFGITITASLIYLKNKLKPKEKDGSASQTQVSLKLVASVFLSLALYVFIIFTDIDFTFTLAQIFFPFIIFICCVSNYEDITVLEAIQRTPTLLAGSWSKFLSSAVVFFILSMILYSTAMYGLKLLFIQDALVWILTDDETTAEKISMGLLAFQSFFSFLLYSSLSVISNSLLYFTVKETQSAEHLIKKIKTISLQK